METWSSDDLRLNSDVYLYCVIFKLERILPFLVPAAVAFVAAFLSFSFYQYFQLGLVVIGGLIVSLSMFNEVKDDWFRWFRQLGCKYRVLSDSGEWLIRVRQCTCSIILRC